MSRYVVSDLDAEFGISHIEADTREEAATAFVKEEILGHAARDILDLEGIEIGVALETDVKIFGIASTFEMTP